MIDAPETIVVPAGDVLLGDPPRTEHVNVFAVARRPVSNDEYARWRADHQQRGPSAVRGVAWADAVGYCRWLSTGTGRIYRLPDEREWEKAARSGVLEQTLPLEWTNSWAQGDGGGRVLKGSDGIALRRFLGERLAEAGFRVVRSMTGR